MQNCEPIILSEGGEGRYYIEIPTLVSGSSMTQNQRAVKKPRVRCDSKELMFAVTQRLNYARQLYNERLHTVAVAAEQSED